MMRKVNKIIAEAYAKFYSEAQNHINKIFQNKEKFKAFASEYHANIPELM